jgi:hypothetical protein
MKLNMGCGNNKSKSHLNVDLSPVCEPDLVADLEVMPWPWQDNSIEEVVFNHCLEHLGRDPRVFLAMFKELYRICRDGACVKIAVPHPRHDNFINDPTHVRAITPALLGLFSQRENDRWKMMGAANTPLAHYLDVDFEITSQEVEIEEPYRTQISEGLLSEEDWKFALRERNNFASEYRIELRVIKTGKKVGEAILPTAFLFEPDWASLDWKTVLQSYLEAFEPGEPVALVIPLEASISTPVAETSVLNVVVEAGLESFPDVLLVDHQENLIDTLRRYASIQWIPTGQEGPWLLTGPLGQRFTQARRHHGSV